MVALPKGYLAMDSEPYRQDKVDSVRRDGMLRPFGFRRLLYIASLSEIVADCGMQT